MNAFKHKSMEMKNRFDTLFYDAECDSADFKAESKDPEKEPNTINSIQKIC